MKLALTAQLSLVNTRVHYFASYSFIVHPVTPLQYLNIWSNHFCKMFGLYNSPKGNGRTWYLAKGYWTLLVLKPPGQGQTTCRVQLDPPSFSSGNFASNMYFFCSWGPAVILADSFQILWINADFIAFPLLYQPVYPFAKGVHGVVTSHCTMQSSSPFTCFIMVMRHLLGL